MTQTQSQTTKILPPPPSLPCPRRNTANNSLPKPPAPTPTDVKTSLPITSFAISSVNTTPIKLPVFSASTCSVAPSPDQRKADIPGNPSTNPFIDLIDATPYYAKVRKGKEAHTLASAVRELELTSTDDQSLIESLPVPAVPPPRPPLPPPCPALPDRSKIKQWQLSPRALIEPPHSSDPAPTPPVYKAVYQYKATQ